MDVFIDFETRGTVDLPTAGISKYASDARTCLLCMAWAIDEAAPSVWYPGESFPWGLAGAIANPEATIHAHNASFERGMWSFHCVGRLGWPELPLRRWECTAARACAAGLPRGLENAAAALGLSLRKDHEGRRVMLKYCKPKPGSSREFYNDPVDLAKIYKYCAGDVILEREIWRNTPPLPARERVIWELDQRINDRGVPIDLDTVVLLIRKYAEYTQELKAELTQLTRGAVTSATQRDNLMSWCNLHGAPLPDLQAATVAEYARKPTVPAATRRALQIRIEQSKSSIAKVDAMYRMAKADGRIRDIALYYGAGTGRWTGKGVQLQNIPRGSLSQHSINLAFDLLEQSRATPGFGLLPTVFGEVSETITQLLRSLIKAEPGKAILAIDFAAIEARVLPWVAGEAELLEQFRQGADVYKALASRIYGVPENKVTDAQRQVGKIAILGLGYGMGASLFAATCEKFGVTLEPEFAEEVVRTYRASYPGITSLWANCQAAAIAATREHSAYRVGKLLYRFSDRWLFCDLPAKRPIAYFKPHLKPIETPWGKRVDALHYLGVNEQTFQIGTTKTYGGKLVENVVQGIARDLLAAAMVRLDRAGFETVFHVHDEVVLEVVPRKGLLEEVTRIVSEVPAWAEGCPISAKGFIAERYRK